jgi:hypothetical protein
MRRTWLGALVAIALAIVVGAAVRAPAPVDAAPAGAPTAPPRYPAVESLFVRGCAGCHDARKATNPAAQRVFEMTSYPFATQRPATLLHDLRKRLAVSGGLTDAERRRVLGWIDGGGLDAAGNAPKWR